jgi:hypothetical protein
MILRKKYMNFFYDTELVTLIYIVVSQGKPEGRNPLERQKHRWEGNIKIYLREVGWGMDLINLAQVR